jgi:hypothetical protein
MGRFEMARILERAWPGIVTVRRRFGRFQHVVDWGRFDDVKLVPADGAVPGGVDEYGMTLRAVREVRSGRVRALLESYPETLSQLGAFDGTWTGLPGFRRQPEPWKLALTFNTEEERVALAEQLGVTVDKRFKDKAWSAWHPPRDREDPASLRFEPVEKA